MKKFSVTRKTKETEINVTLSLYGKSRCKVSTGIPFLNHMIELMGSHAGFDLAIDAKGDLEVDFHHTVEDIGLTFGEAFDKILNKRKGIARFGWAIIPMDEALSTCAVDLGGRPYLVMSVACKCRKILDFDLGLIREFLRAFTVKGRLNIHINQMYGKDPHHCYESLFKALGQALKKACRKENNNKIPSTKGKI